MTETTHTRSRRASLGGLCLQCVAFAAVLIVAVLTHSQATYNFAWYMLGGIPIWFVALLVFRQRELAALETLDLEELRREKQASGGGEALFGEEGGAALGFRVAEARLNWMHRWLIPGFGLLNAVYLGVMGLILWRRLAVQMPAVGAGGWPEMAAVPKGMVIVAILMLVTFLYSRYTSGIGRTREWQLLRGCGAYLLGNAIVAMALLVGLGIHLATAKEGKAGWQVWEQCLAYFIPVLMVLLGIETLVNFVLDVYRPRAPGVEPRACFDSRLLGLLAEPGGIASSIAEAMNYQFGFQVSHTWFYRLLQRAFVPLVGTGAIALWALTCVVVVQPYEHVIVERFGRQLHPDAPLRPGLHWKLPWPIDIARPYNTGQLHQINVGFQSFDAELVYGAEGQQSGVLLWTDEKHLGHPHFDFLVSPPPSSEEGKREETAPVGQPIVGFGGERGEEARGDTPVHTIRMQVVVQYRIRDDQLDLYTQQVGNTPDLMRNIAWEGVVRLNAAFTVDGLLGADLPEAEAILWKRIADRVEDLDLGLDVVYVGIANVHPEKTVSEAFRNVISAELEKVADIRKALVTQDDVLSAVAGDPERAWALADAISRFSLASKQLNVALRAPLEVDAAVLADLERSLAELRPEYDQRFQAAYDLEKTEQRLQRVTQDTKDGLGPGATEEDAAAAAGQAATSRLQAATEALEAKLEPAGAAAKQRGLTEEQIQALFARVEAQAAERFWSDHLEWMFRNVEGEVAELRAKSQAERWQSEMGAAAELARALNERDAYMAAPEVYRARLYLDTLVSGLKEARKLLLAFDPGDRLVRVRIVAEDEPHTEVIDLSPSP